MPMTLDVTLLERLADWKPGPGRHTLAVPDQGSGWSAALTADRADQIGCLVWEVDLRRSTAEPPDVAALRGWADRLAQRVTGLLEPLRLIEVDSERNEAFLRSDRPAEKGEEVAYYELFLHGTNAATLRRYTAPRTSGRREQVAFALTREALAKITADITAAK
jgi:hypothetical protein